MNLYLEIYVCMYIHIHMHRHFIKCLRIKKISLKKFRCSPINIIQIKKTKELLLCNKIMILISSLTE